MKIAVPRCPTCKTPARGIIETEDMPKTVAHVRAFTLHGTVAVPVDIEVDLLRRLPRVAITGLPAGAVQETAERVRSAILSSGYEFPRMRTVITVTAKNAMGEAVPVRGTGLDLAIAVGILVADGQIKPTTAFYLGELSLGGDIRPVRGTVAAAVALASSNPREVHLVTHHEAFAAAYFGRWVSGARTLREAIESPVLIERAKDPAILPTLRIDTDEVVVRNPLTVANALRLVLKTRVPVLLIGRGKAMLARRFSTLLPDIDYATSQDVTTLCDVAGIVDGVHVVSDRPFRAPHHTVTLAGMFGDRLGRPGEYQLAQHGALYLDEVDEFPAHILETVQRTHDATLRSSIRWDREKAPVLLMGMAGVGDVEHALAKILRVFPTVVVIDLGADGDAREPLPPSADIRGPIERIDHAWEASLPARLRGLAP